MPDNELIAAVGAGRMGRGIAITFAYAGYSVLLVDIKERTQSEFGDLCKSAEQEIRSTLTMLSEFELLSNDEIEAVASRVSYHSRKNCANALARADVVFEGVPETEDAKQAALALISRSVSPNAIVASTTSTMLSDSLQAWVTHPQRFLNAHWLNPAFLVPLVELSPGADTDQTVTDRLVTLLETIGKVPVVCAASPGYMVPRIQALAMNEAARMVEEGVASAEDIDKATKYGFGFRFAVLGLLEFIDWGGGDILFYASRYMTSATGEDRFASPKIIEDNMRKGRTGLAARQGFLDYSTMDVAAYQRQRLAAFVDMLRHIDKLPIKGDTTAVRLSDIDTEDFTTRQKDPAATVKSYLDAMEQRNIEKSQTFLAPGFCMTFPGGVVFSEPQELIKWAKTRYQSVGKQYERFDVCQSASECAVYCYGTLSGVWLNGSDFNGIRFIDRFTIANGLITSQLVWNDLAEVSSSGNAENTIVELQ